MSWYYYIPIVYIVIGFITTLFMVSALNDEILFESAKEFLDEKDLKDYHKSVERYKESPISTFAFYVIISPVMLVWEFITWVLFGRK